MEVTFCYFEMKVTRGCCGWKEAALFSLVFVCFTNNVNFQVVSFGHGVSPGSHVEIQCYV